MKLPPFWSTHFYYCESRSPSIVKIHSYIHKNYAYVMRLDNNRSTKLQFESLEHTASWMPDVLEKGSFK